jgi:hypothetical protein
MLLQACCVNGCVHKYCTTDCINFFAKISQTGAKISCRPPSLNCSASRSIIIYSFSLGAKQGIPRCRKKKLQLPHLWFFTIQIQYVCNMEAPVFGSARSACYFTRYIFFTRKQVGYRPSVLNPRRKIGYPVSGDSLSVHTAVTSHLGGPLRQVQLIVCSTLFGLQKTSFKSLVKLVTRGVREPHIRNRKRCIRFTARPD